MSGSADLSWQTVDQARLVAALAEVRRALEAHTAHGAGEAPTARRPGPPDHEGEPAALDLLAATFGLSSFERDVLLLCAGIELDAGFASLCAAAQGDPARTYPTFGLALASLPGAHWSALTPEAPLRYWRLIELGPGGGLTSAPLRIDERVLHHLAGLAYLDERLSGTIAPEREEGALVPTHRALAEQVAATWSMPASGRGLPVIQLCGDDPSGKRAVAAAACEALGLGLHALRAELIPAAPGDLEAMLRLWEREAALGGLALLVDAEETDGTDPSRAAALVRMVERVSGAVIVATRERRRFPRRATAVFDVHKPGPAEQRDAWAGALGEAAGRLNGQIDEIVAQFSLGASAIAAIAAEAAGPGNADLARSLWSACRRQARPRLDELARRIEPAAGWADLVLPEAQRQTLRDIVAHARQRSRVYEAWGFAARQARGAGITALFTGASGTGKTLAAEVIAHELGFDLYRIDLSQVVSKYIGETEKNLRRVFDAAEEGGAVLLFDEADALFGKRSEVKDSHDRYANIEVSYLLQRMEEYRGLAILTTNLKGALDPAFLRRLRFVVAFPFPDAAQRAEIWRQIFPAAAPTEGLDPARLAGLTVAGGNIRNIALHGAFLAAEAGEPVRMAHLLRAARAEYAKIEKPLVESEIEGWT